MVVAELPVALLLLSTLHVRSTQLLDRAAVVRVGGAHDQEQVDDPMRLRGYQERALSALSTSPTGCESGGMGQAPLVRWGRHAPTMGVGAEVAPGLGAPEAHREATRVVSCIATATSAATMGILDPMSSNPLHGIIACDFCGASGGSMAYGRDGMCRRCAAELDPTPLQEWAWAAGVELAELPEMCGLAERTVMRAARGIRIGAQAAKKLSEVTGEPVESFTIEARFKS